MIKGTEKLLDEVDSLNAETVATLIAELERWRKCCWTLAETASAIAQRQLTLEQELLKAVVENEVMFGLLQGDGWNKASVSAHTEQAVAASMDANQETIERWTQVLDNMNRIARNAVNTSLIPDEKESE